MKSIIRPVLAGASFGVGWAGLYLVFDYYAGGQRVGVTMVGHTVSVGVAVFVALALWKDRGARRQQGYRHEPT